MSPRAGGPPLVEGAIAASKLSQLVEAMMPKPRRPVVEKMCEFCPFRPDRGAPKVTVDDDDMEAFRAQAEIGEFYCHETALEDPRTACDPAGEPIGVQPHFEVCRGAWEHKRAKLEEKLRAAGRE